MYYYYYTYLLPREGDGVRIRIIFEGDHGVSAGFLAKVLNTVTGICEKSDETEVKELLNEYLGANHDALALALKRLKQLKGAGVYVERAERGSLIIFASLSGLAYWVLDRTLGESLKEAWKESALHSKIKESLLRRRESKIREIMLGLAQKLSRIKGLATKGEMAVTIERNEIVIRIREQAPEERII